MKCREPLAKNVMARVVALIFFSSALTASAACGKDSSGPCDGTPTTCWDSCYQRTETADECDTDLSPPAWVCDEHSPEGCFDCKGQFHATGCVGENSPTDCPFSCDDDRDAESVHTDADASAALDADVSDASDAEPDGD